MQSLKDIRRDFLDYFMNEDHEVVASSSLVPQNDPTLMFTNAGMNQFKNVFTGNESRPYIRAASAQKCVRAGGKHNDLDNVGYTARHHTFFEMLGNFSFGDYFKEEAIHYAWELLTRDLGLSPERMLVTVYAEDDEAFKLWKKISGYSDEKIIRIATSDNFWSMGDTGPCGPCSEIFYDHGDHIWGGPPGSPEEDGDRFVEIWNLVFMQYDQISTDTRVDLPKPSIDTGMGLERIAAVLQGVHNNYDVDLFQNIIKVSEELTGNRDEALIASHRVISDHLRSTCFLMSDGVLPSNEGRGYVLRRIMRRAMRHAHILGAKEPLMHRLVPALISEMGEAYPELVRAKSLMTETLRLEEERFRQTLDRGLKLLDEATADMGEGDELSGEVAFKLYDTYGFPIDLTEDALRGRSMGVDSAGFEAAMERQKAEARAAWKGSGETATDEVWFDLKDRLGATEFLGYETERAEGLVTAILKGGAEVEAASEGDEVVFLTNQTPFYGESGGQVGDQGLGQSSNAELVITDTIKKLGDVHGHVAKITKGSLKVGDAVDLRVDHEKRSATRANHSATHLLHAALRNVLGDHVTQKGSLVNDERLRFDFSHPKALSPEEVEAIERQANRVLRGNDEVVTRLMTPEEAMDQGAMALFGEKYGEEVRVLSMGTDHGNNYSVELCGGTHVNRLGDIGIIKITGDSAVAAGVRRIEAVTGEGARIYLNAQAELLREAADALKTSPAELPDRIAALVAERKKLDKELADARKALAFAGESGGAGGPVEEEIGGVKFIGQVLTGVSPKDLPGVIDDAKSKLGSGVVAFACVNEGKAAVAVGVTADLTDKVSAVDLVRVGVEAVGGKGGGGRPDMARGGGPNGDDADKAIAAVRARLAG
ncbi:MAG: alanine--tRNA ligase [Alphaproteobacteria bacterium]|nr:MAG: alanine--tRNA ligase [Alphaproteobacteria bacterium]